MTSTKIARRQAYGMEGSDVAPTIFGLCDEIDNLRAQLAKAQAELAEAEELCEISEEGRVLFMNQLAEAQAEVRRLKEYEWMYKDLQK